MRNKLSKKLAIELILQQIESLKDDISTLKNQRMELQTLEHRERNLIRDEVVAEQKIIYSASLQKIKEEFAVARKKSESSLREYESQPIDLEVTHEQIARKLAEKIGEIHAR